MNNPPIQGIELDTPAGSGTSMVESPDANTTLANQHFNQSENSSLPQPGVRKSRSAKTATRTKAPRKRAAPPTTSAPLVEEIPAIPPANEHPPQLEDDTPPAAPQESPGEKDRQPKSRRANAKQLPQQSESPKDAGSGDGESQTRRRGRRGKRGGKNRGHKTLIFRMPLEIVAAITTFPALPPGGTPRKSRREESQRNEKKPPAIKSEKRMLISVMPHEQVEVALVEDGKLLEYYLDMLHQRKIKGNIYKGVVHNIDINLQAAFVDYGAGKNGFLQIDQVHPEYWQSVQETEKGKKFPPIQKVLKIGQELLVQVVKEPAGSKGAFLTTWLSLAGRFLVLTPGQEQIGVSRKVTEPEERARLRELMSGIDPGNGFGVIVRTVGEGANKTTLKNDLQYLKRLWREIRKKATESSAPSQIYQEPGLPERSVRDYLTEDVSEIWVDDGTEAEHVRAMVALLYPRKKDLVHLYEESQEPIWDKFHLRGQLSQIYDREVFLPSGGRLVFDQTEALMAIDINSGRISGKGNFENMAFKTNMEAAEAIARQLRLRDVGGQVVIDFIEMRDKNHVLEVEKCLRQAMKGDRAKHDVARMSSFGLLELVRQRMGSSALSICLEVCPMCNGTGMRRNLEWHAQQSLGELRQKLHHFSGSKFTFELPRELGMYLLNQKREALRHLEEETGKTLEICITI